MTVFASDVSEFQPPASDAYTRNWLTFRACDGSYVDRNLTHNLAWATAARTASKLINFTVYAVYRPGMNSTVLGNLSHFGVPTDCVIMVDVESWSGEIRGDHSTDITALVTALRARQDNRPDLVWCYGNKGDLASVYPHRPTWLPIVVASYGTQQPANPGPGPLAGWQYTDGAGGNPMPNGYPNSSAPFGHCDHNVIFSTPSPEGNPLMADSLSPAVVAQLRAIVAEEVRAQFNLFTRTNSDDPHKPSPGHQIRTVVFEQIQGAVKQINGHTDAQTGKLAHSPDFGLDSIPRTTPPAGAVQ